MNILFRTTSNLRYFVRIVISNLFEKKTDSQFIQNCAALVYKLFINK